MLKKCLLLILLVFLTYSNTVEAANWVNIGKGEAVLLYVDSDSIKDGLNGAKEAWFMYQHTPPDCASSYAKSLKKCVATYTNLEWLFKNKTYCRIGFAHYFTDGTNTGYSATPCEIEKINPGTASEIKWKYIYR